MLPLQDLRIIAVEQYGAGPFGSMLLADLGAEVIKIEDPLIGDVARYVPPFQEGEDSLFFETFNRNKQSLSLDVRSPAGRSVLEDLVRVSDALYSNLRGDIPERLGLLYQDLRAVNPRIVCVSLSGFGMTGPRRAQPAYDYILQGVAGWMSVTGDPDGPPTKSGLSMVDFSGGMIAALALLSGVHAARRDGLGMDCDTSLFDTALAMTTYLSAWHLTGGFTPERTRSSAHPSMVPFQNFQVADGWIVVACAKEKFWQALVQQIGRPELGADPRFHSFAARSLHSDELRRILAEVFLTRPAAEWLERLTGGGVPCAPVNTIEQAFADPQTKAREMILEVEHPRWGTVRQVAGPLRVGSEPHPKRRGPARNENADQVLGELLGYSAEKRAELAAAGAFGAG